MMSKSKESQTGRPDVPVQERYGANRGGEFGTRERTGMVRGEGELRDQISEAYSDGREMVDGMVSRYPYSSVLTGFGFGFSFGLVVTLLLTRREPSWVERYVPESLQHLPERFRDLPDRLKRLEESVASSLPRSWKPW
jgi:hypothetical protein